MLRTSVSAVSEVPAPVCSDFVFMLLDDKVEFADFKLC
jgi:hypothetical protein